MEILEKVGLWANKLTQIGVSVIALGVVLEVLFGGAGIPFWPEVSVVDNKPTFSKISIKLGF